MTTPTSRRRTEGSGGNRRGRREYFGSVRKLPSGRFQARYTGPDGLEHKADTTFEAAVDAHGWLSLRQSEIILAKWRPPVPDTATRFGDFAASWLKARRVRGRPLKPRTHAHYQSLLARHLLPAFGARRLRDITPEAVEAWHEALGPDTPTQRAHAYSLLKSILASAVEKRLVDFNPCTLRGAGSTGRARRIEPATLDELKALVAALPDRYRVMIHLAAWGGLRFGELTELRRKDVDLTSGMIHVQRAVVRVGGEVVVGTPKSDAGMRAVALPPHLSPDVAYHLAEHVKDGGDALMFPSSRDPQVQLHANTLYKSWNKARDAAGRPDLRFHDLRHTGAVLAARTGASLVEIMERLGHSTPGAALQYQHAAAGRDTEIAAALSKIAAGEAA